MARALRRFLKKIERSPRSIARSSLIRRVPFSRRTVLSTRCSQAAPTMEANSAPLTENRTAFERELLERWAFNHAGNVTVLGENLNVSAFELIASTNGKEGESILTLLKARISFKCLTDERTRLRNRSLLL